MTATTPDRSGPGAAGEWLAAGWGAARWVGRNYWAYRKYRRFRPGSRAARRAMLAAPIGITIFSVLFERKAQVLLRARIHPGAGIALRIVDPAERDG